LFLNMMSIHKVFINTVKHIKAELRIDH